MVLWPFARVCGNDPRAVDVFMAAGLDFSQLMQPEARLPHATAMRLLENLIDALEDPALGLKAGMAARRGDMAVVEQVANTRPTLRAASDVITRYLKLLNDASSFSLHEDGDTAYWAYQTRGTLEPPAVHDFVVAALYSYTRIFTGRGERRLSIRFAHGDRTNLAAYRALFQCTVEFDQPHTGATFPAEILDWPLRDPIFALAPIVEARASEQLNKVEAEHTLSERLQETLLSAIEHGLDTTMSTTASRLGMSIATLRRRLSDEETTYTELLNEARKHLAISLIENQHLDAAEISHFLGFSDPAAFHRAFRRWTGTTPGSYAKRRTSDSD